MKTAPFYNDVAEAPADARAYWLYARDGVRLRLTVCKGGDKGTILLFSGRTEFAEKYGRTVTALQALGYGVAVVDWRGQGLSDRLSDNRALGHVGAFSDYQLDVAAMLEAADEMGLSRPWNLLSHSMGGAIALRALHEGLEVDHTIFSAPMWALKIDPMLRPMIQAVAAGGSSVGLGEEFSPGTNSDIFLATGDFENNTLTSSEESWRYISNMVKTHPGLGIGGPSFNWVYESMAETRALSHMAPPDYPAMCLIGSNEKVVNKRDVLAYMDKWPGALSVVLSGGEHETFMETAAIRARAVALLDLFFSS